MCVDTVFCSSSICMLDPEKSKNIFFSPWGRENIQNDVVQPVQTSEHPKCLFLAKMTKMPLVNPRFDRMSNEVKALTNFFFHGFT